jgi:hypothetical protein
LEVLSPAGKIVATQNWTKQGHSSGGNLKLKAAGNGWHTLRLTSANLSAEGNPFELTVTYTATQEISA